MVWVIVGSVDKQNHQQCGKFLIVYLHLDVLKIRVNFCIGDSFWKLWHHEIYVAIQQKYLENVGHKLRRPEMIKFICKISVVPHS